LYVAASFLSRFLTLYSTIFLVSALWLNPKNDTRSRKIVSTASFLGSLIPIILGYLIFNQIRFANPFQSGYAFIPTEGWERERIEKYGLFHPIYIPFNFVYLFVQGFHIQFEWPTLLKGYRLDGYGTSLTFASPFLFAALRAKWDVFLLRAAWISILLMLVHQLFYHTNGFEQPNAQRYSLDYMPILILLAGLGKVRISEKLWKAAICYSVILNVLALTILPTIHLLTK
jgi:hypothetical protein